MKRLLLITALIASNLWATGQNLVPNWSFETFTLCPNASSQLPSAVPWTAPTNNSSDYFNACAPLPPASYFGVPYAGGGGGFQYAKDGNAFAAIYFLNGIGGNYREYLEIGLLDSMINGNCYYAEFYVNLNNRLKTGCNNISGNFSKTQYSTTGPGNVLSLSQDIINYQNPRIYDTLNWVKVSGIYIANGGEDHFTIGNFKNDALTDTIVLPYGVNPGVCYYYVDAVSVYSINPIGPLPWTYRDTTVNAGDSVFIGNMMGGSFSSNWYTLPGVFIKNAPGIYVKPTTTSDYVVTFTICGVPHSDTLKVTVSGNVGIGEFGLQSSEFLISPNPNNGFVNVEILSKGFEVGETELRIKGVLGNEIKKVQLVSKKQQVNLAELNNGIYFFEFVWNSQTVITKKVVKQ